MNSTNLPACVAKELQAKVLPTHSGYLPILTLGFSHFKARQISLGSF